MNYATLEGRLGTDPTTKEIGDTTLCTARLAVRRYDPKADGKFVTDWYTINAWGKGSASLARLQKGESIVVFGRIELKEYEDKQGNVKLDPSIYVLNTFGPKKWVEEDAPSPKTGGSRERASKREDDLPF